MTVQHAVSAEPVRPSSVSNTDTGPRAEGELLGALSDEILVGEDGDTETQQDRAEHQPAQEPGRAAQEGRGPDELQQESADDVLCEPCGEDDAEEEEAEPKRIAPSPTLPSAAEIDDHRICHFPYRNWCPHCVAGRALGERRGA